MSRPRKPAHFKVFVNIKNHRKTSGFADDPLLLGIYVNIGLMAVERWAGTTSDSFFCSGFDLQRLAGCQGVANARRRLGRLEARGGPTVSQEGAGYRLTIRNLNSRQGFPDPKVPKRGTPTTTTATATPSDNRGVPDPPDGVSSREEGKVDWDHIEPGDVPDELKRKLNRQHEIDIGNPNFSTYRPPKKDVKKPSPRKQRTLCPEVFTSEEWAEIDSWNDKRKSDIFTRSQLDYAFETMHEKSHGRGTMKNLNWVTAFKGYLREGWVLKSYVDPNPTPTGPDAVFAASLRKLRAEEAAEKGEEF